MSFVAEPPYSRTVIYLTCNPYRGTVNSKKSPLKRKGGGTYVTGLKFKKINSDRAGDFSAISVTE